MGLGEGVAFPAIHAAIARSVPAEHQSGAVGVVTAASYVGTALAFGLAPTIIEDLGWPVRRLLLFALLLRGACSGGWLLQLAVRRAGRCYNSTAAPANTLLGNLSNPSSPLPHCLTPPLPPLQWVFYIFGASAVLWLPLWLPQRIEGGGRGGGGASSSKAFNLLDLFASTDAADGAGAGPGSARSLQPSASLDSFSPREGARLQRQPTALSDDYPGGWGAAVAVVEGH